MCAGDVWDGAVTRLVVVTSLLVWAETNFRNVYKCKQTIYIYIGIATSVVDGLAAPKPPSRVAISCSGRVSISGSELPARHLFLGPPVRVT